MIGVLNSHLQNLSLRCTKKGSAAPLHPNIGGNPLKGERLLVSWTELNTGGAWLHLSFAPVCFVAAVCLRLGEAAAPTAVRVWDDTHTRCFTAYRGETGKPIAERALVLPVSAETSSLLVEIDSDLDNLDLLALELFGATDDGPDVFPSPRAFVPVDGVCSLSSLKTIACRTPDETLAGKILAEKLGELGSALALTTENGDIALVTDESIAENGYRLTVSDRSVTIAASDLRGMVMGAETLCKLVKNGSLPCGSIDDAPAHAFRGVHLYLPSVAEMGFAKRLVKYLLSPLGYNAVFLEIAGAMQFDSHPEVNVAVQTALAKARAGEWPSFPHGGVGGGTVVPKAAVRDFCDYVRSFGIDVIPEIQSLGHVQFLTLAHPEIAERAADAVPVAPDNEREADIPPDAFYAHSFCPSNPRSYELLFDLADEIIGTVAPQKYVHMGHDEVYQIGLCPRCSQKDPAELFAEDLCRLHAYLAKKGLKMMIWADMLQANSPYKTVAALEKIPKDIFLLDFIWYFHPERDIEDALLPAGLPVAFGNLYSSHFPRFSSRAAKPGVIGGQISMWAPTALAPLARDGKLYDICYTAEMLWAEHYAEEARTAYDAVISARIPRLREQLEDRRYPSLAPNSARQTVWQREQPTVPADGTLCSFSGCAQSLIFTHTALGELRRVPWSTPTVLARYTVVYADGSECDVPIAYGTTVGFFGRRKNAPMAGMYHRHTGYMGATWHTDEVLFETADGSRKTLFRYEWINPRPDTPISRIRYAAEPDALAAVAVQKIAAVL